MNYLDKGSLIFVSKLSRLALGLLNIELFRLKKTFINGLYEFLCYDLYNYVIKNNS